MEKKGCFWVVTFFALLSAAALTAQVAGARPVPVLAGAWEKGLAAAEAKLFLASKPEEKKSKQLAIAFANWKIPLPDALFEIRTSSAVRFQLPGAESHRSKNANPNAKEAWRAGSYDWITQCRAIVCTEKGWKDEEYMGSYAGFLKDGRAAEEESIKIQVGEKKYPCRCLKATGKRIRKGSGWRTWRAHKVWIVLMKKEKNAIAIQMRSKDQEETAREFLKGIRWLPKAQDHFSLTCDQFTVELPSFMDRFDLTRQGFCYQFPRDGVKITEGLKLPKDWDFYMRILIGDNERLAKAPDALKKFPGLFRQGKKGKLELNPKFNKKKIGRREISSKYTFTKGYEGVDGNGMPLIGPASASAIWTFLGTKKAISFSLEGNGPIKGDDPKRQVQGLMELLAENTRLR